jgi:gliding motility-associated-like protein
VLFLCLLSAPSVFCQLRFLHANSNFNMNSQCLVAPAQDGGWALFSTSLNGVNIARYDRCGLLLWAKHYTTPVSITCNDAIASRYGGFVVTGYFGNAYPYNCHPYLLRVKDDGSIRFCKYYQGNVNEHIYSVGEDSHGNLYTDGNSDAGGTDLGHNFILKTDSLGTLVWTKLYGTGGYWALGMVTSFDALVRCEGLGNIYQIDQNGNIMWVKQGYNGPRYKPVEVSDGYVYFCYGTYNGSLVKIDFNGNLVWRSRSYSSLVGGGGFIKSIAALPGDHVVVCVGPVMMEFDQLGNYVRSSRLQHDSTAAMTITDIAYLPDRSLLVAGKQVNAFSAKTDLQLLTGCADTLANSDTIASYPLTIVSTGLFSGSATFIENSITATATDFDPMETTVCESREDVSLTVAPPGEICSGNSTVITASAAASDLTYAWYEDVCGGNLLDTGESVTVSPAATQTYFVNAAGFCDTSACISVTAVVHPNPEAAFQASYEFSCQGASLLLLNGSSGADIYAWSISDGFTSAETNIWHPIQPNQEYLVTLVASTEYCSDTADITSDLNSLFDSLNIVVPNVFTPNSDGLNDEFHVSNSGNLDQCIDIKIFDRWGLEVFSSRPGLRSWNGCTPFGFKCPQGTYFYQISIAGMEYHGALQLIE